MAIFTKKRTDFRLITGHSLLSAILRCRRRSRVGHREATFGSVKIEVPARENESLIGGSNMINCEWIRKQKKERPSHGSSPGPKCKPNVRLRVKSANTQQPCFSELCDAWLLRKRDEIRESSYIKYRAILERHIKPRLGSRRLGGICTASPDSAAPVPESPPSHDRSRSW